MSSAARFEYRLVTVNDDTTAVNNHMNAWAEAGWELVSGGASGWAAVGPPDRVGVATQVWHTRYILYWRKPIVAG